MKKRMLMVLAAGMTVAMVACGTETPAGEPVVTEAATPTEEAAPTETEAEPTEAEAEPTEAEAEPTEAEAAADVMSHADYVAAAVDDAVKVDVYVQATQSWWEDKITVYAADEDGAYFIYNMACSEEDSAKLTQGAHILVSGFKAEWSGEVEIADATFEFVDDTTFVVDKAEDVTDLLGKDELIDHQNEFVAFNDLEVVAKQDADGNDVAFLYNWDGSGTPGSDLYFDVKAADDNVYTFTVESYLCGQDTDVYKAVEGLKVGDKIDAEGFLYWYEGVNPHITKVTVK